MASRKQKTKATPAVSTPVAEQAPANTSGGKKKAAKRRASTAVAKRRGPGRPKGAKNRPKSARRQRYSPAEKAKILAVARSEGLTGAQVAKKFGVSALSYYTWRKLSGAPSAKRGGGRLRTASAQSDGSLSGNLHEMVRQEVRARIREMLPEILQHELSGALDTERRRS